MNDVKLALVGLEIQDVSLTNHRGERHARLILGDNRLELLVPLENVMITVAERKPMRRALTATGQIARVG